MKNHTDFILSPLLDALEEGLVASRNIHLGIEGYPLVEYILPSLFLRMTGAQEQKLKCICWEMATVDYEYRRNFLQNQQSYGSYSSFEQKNKVYKDIVCQIQSKEKKFKPHKCLNTNDIILEMRNAVAGLFDHTFIMEATKREYMFFCSDFSKEIESEDIATDTLLRGKAELINKYLFDHRNGTAHNTLSYQSDHPDFITLKSDEHKYDNYYFYFSLLLIIDKVFTKLFKKFMDVYDI